MDHVWLNAKSTTNRFFLPRPVGGNFWGAIEANGNWPRRDMDEDAIGDFPYLMRQIGTDNTGAKDELPWIKPSGWVPVIRELGGYPKDLHKEHPRP
jgi:hypothetical protein